MEAAIVESLSQYDYDFSGASFGIAGPVRNGML
jgi:hypothetical protein